MAAEQPKISHRFAAVKHRWNRDTVDRNRTRTRSKSDKGIPSDLTGLCQALRMPDDTLSNE